MSIRGISRSFRPWHTGVIYFPLKARAPVPQRQSITRVRPIIDPQQIRISPSLQVAGYQAMHNATPAEEPSIASMRYKSSRLYMNAKGELVQIQDPEIDVKQEISPVTEQLSSQGSDMERQNLQSTSSSRVGVKWWLLLLCFVFLWYMRPSGETNRQDLLGTNQAPKDLRTRIQRNRDSEFEFMQTLAYEMSKRPNIDLMALG
ncbi:hypothetical protein BDV34DRAFT_196275 [Aspergillus parasiticus]|uniref:Uncharacterized protein n=1 Tax=Aspergillus parasiticus TaxID=5067 RepID=A0A5N6DJ83_ASPPA|nr:hypothetical protein BDV34DRAFT_196275 [Aspergillus parasiticus]